MTLIAKGAFTAVVDFWGRYYAAKRETNTINVFGHNRFDQWKPINSISIDMKEMSNITLGISNDMLYVCSFLDNKIDAYTHNGIFLFTKGKPGNKAVGQLNWPVDCDCDWPVEHRTTGASCFDAEECMSSEWLSLC